MQSLPAENPYQTGTPQHQAYDSALVVQAVSPLHGRVLGYTLIFAIGDEAIAREIVNCQDQNQCQVLAEFYTSYLLRCCEYPIAPYYWRDQPQPILLLVKGSRKGPTPAHTEHPSRPSFDVIWKDAMDSIECAPENHADAKRKVIFIIVLYFLCFSSGNRHLFETIFDAWLPEGRTFCISLKVQLVLRALQPRQHTYSHHQSIKVSTVNRRCILLEP